MSRITLPCSRCKKNKPLEKFRRRSNRPESGKRLGRWSHCLECEKDYQKSDRNKELSKERQERFRNKLKRENPEEAKRRERQQNLKRLHGITIEEYNAQAEKQNGKCAICGLPPVDGRGKKLHVDHNHKTNINRELLCTHCNKGLGCFKENVETLQNAIEYLKKHMTITQPIS